MSSLSPWVLLALAILAETVGSAALKASDGFSRVGPSLLVAAGFGLAFVLVSRAIRELSIGVVYAVWAGVGTALAALVGVLVFGEALALAHAAGIALVIAGVVILNLKGTAGHGAAPAPPASLPTPTTSANRAANRSH